MAQRSFSRTLGFGVVAGALAGVFTLGLAGALEACPPTAPPPPPSARVNNVPPQNGIASGGQNAPASRRPTPPQRIRVKGESRSVPRAGRFDVPGLSRLSGRGTAEEQQRVVGLGDDPGERPVSDGVLWQRAYSVEGALDCNRREGMPLLLYIDAAGVSDDCCGAKFEYMFGYKPFVKLSRQFECFHLRSNLEYIRRNLEPFGVEAQKSTLLMLDGDGYPLHFQNCCTDSDSYVRSLKAGIAANQTRMRTRHRGTQLYDEALAHRRGGAYGKALSLLDRIAGQGHVLLPKDLTLVMEERQSIEKTGYEILAEGQAQLERRDFANAYETLKCVRREFSRVAALHREAERLARQAFQGQRKEGDDQPR